MTEIRVLLSTCPPDRAAELARGLVERRLAACVNIVATIASVYRWEGKICEDTESLLVIKTTRARVDELTAALVEAHPYDVPEVIALPVESGSEPYLRWVAEGAAGG